MEVIQVIGRITGSILAKSSTHKASAPLSHANKIQSIRGVLMDGFGLLSGMGPEGWRAHKDAGLNLYMRGFSGKRGLRK